MLPNVIYVTYKSTKKHYWRENFLRQFPEEMVVPSIYRLSDIALGRIEGASMSKEHSW